MKPSLKKYILRSPGKTNIFAPNYFVDLEKQLSLSHGSGSMPALPVTKVEMTWDSTKETKAREEDSVVHCRHSAGNTAVRTSHCSCQSAILRKARATGG